MATSIKTIVDFGVGLSGYSGTSPPNYSTSIGDGVATSYTITHNFGKSNVFVWVRDTGTNYFVYPDIKFVNTNSVTLEFVSAPTLNQYYVQVFGF